MFAHSGSVTGEWQPLSEHLLGVADLARSFLKGWAGEEEVYLAGLLHDVGKHSEVFQARLRNEVSGLDHWSMGAWLALYDFRAMVAALIIQGHHIGIQDFSKANLAGLNPAILTKSHPLGLELSGALPTTRACVELASLKEFATTYSSVERMLDIRMMYSALVDADFLDTERHMNNFLSKCRENDESLNPNESLAVLLDHLDGLQSAASDDVTQARVSLRKACLGAAGGDSGLFTLTAPTGSGKTLSMLAFALKHAQVHGLKRIIIVVPYLSIIEQTAKVYKDLFSRPGYILEHHSLSGMHPSVSKILSLKHKLLSQNWDAPIVITTSVQMLESLFSNRSSSCRKLHNMRDSVILFDEVQTLPRELVDPTLKALSHLSEEHNSTIVLATATQPAFKHFKSWEAREIVVDEVNIKPRVNYHWHWDPMSWDNLARRCKEESQVLCVVNLKRHANFLFAKIEGAYYLSTNMCPAHRTDVLNQVRVDLKAGKPCRLVSTQCIEAGVDIDFPVVYRAFAPFEAIIQAAGRCNRSGLLDRGHVHVFRPFDEGYPGGGGYEQAAQVTKMFLRANRDNIRMDDPSFIREYYEELYDITCPEEANLTRDILAAVESGRFPKVAELYRLISQDAINILVPYDKEAFKELRKEYEKNGIKTGWTQRAQPFSVSIFTPKNGAQIWGSLDPTSLGGGEKSGDWYILTDHSLYNKSMGLSV